MMRNSPMVYYTDGSCKGNPGPGGWAAVVVGTDEEISGEVEEDVTTNHRAELTAVYEALRYHIKHHPSRPFHLQSDSLNCIRGLTSKKLKRMSELAKGCLKSADLWQPIWEMQKRIRGFSAEHVKGHSGNYWNERADELASLRAFRIDPEAV